MNIKITRAGLSITRAGLSITAAGLLRRLASNLGLGDGPPPASGREQLGTVCFGPLGASEQLALHEVIADDVGAVRVPMPARLDAECTDPPE
jgi:hypothetical protein